MISRLNNGNFFTAHYEWVIAVVGLIALIAGGVVFALSLGTDAEEAGADMGRRVAHLQPAENGVKPVDMGALKDAAKNLAKPPTTQEVNEKKPSYLASERRVICQKCKKVISGDIREFPNCPFCNEPQQEEKKVVLDADGDGMPDEWEKRYGLNPATAADAQADLDGDGFTNLEEFQAKTDPQLKTDHPDYLDSIKIVLPLKETHMPFVFRQAMKVPAGWRCTFFDSTRESATDRRKKGANVTALVGEEVGETGFIVKSYTPKTEKRSRKGMSGKVDVDVSEVVVERKSDKKCVTLVVQPKGLRYAAVDVQATLEYTRGAVKNFEVVPGAEIDLNGTKYVIAAIEKLAKGAKVTFEKLPLHEKRTLQALEP